MSDVISTLTSHVSQRKYTDQDIEPEVIRTLINAARRSPSSNNMQPYSFIVVRNPETKKRLAMLAGNQKHIETCPVFIAICADITRLMRACEMHGKELARNTENFLVSSVDSSIVGMALAAAAESIGLGTVMIGGIRNNPAEAAELLGCPEGVYIVYGMCLGFPQKALEQKPRLPEEAVIHYESFDNSGLTSHLEAYDAELAEHYRSTNRQTPDAAWTGVIAEKFSKPNRPKLKAILEKLGFRLD